MRGLKGTIQNHKNYSRFHEKVAEFDKKVASHFKGL
jgi:hypothetical protein